MAKRPIGVEDLFRIEFLGQVELSPDASRAAYVVTHSDLDKDGYRSAIHVLDLATGASVKFTAGLHKDQQPAWSPDGSQIAFISNRSGKNQIWVIDADGGEARQVTKVAAGAGDHRWSPDGRYFAFVSKVKAGEGGLEEGQDKPDKNQSDVRVINRMRYKANGVGFLGDSRPQIFVVAAEGGPARQITAGDYDHDNPAWSPDGKQLAFAANRTEDEDYSTVKDIWRISALAGDPIQVTVSKGTASHPLWSADGQTIFYVGHDGEFVGATHSAIWSVPAAGGEQVRLTDPDLALGSGVTWDMTPGPTGLPMAVGGGALYFTSATKGQSHVFRTPVAGGPTERVTAGVRNVYSFSVSPDGQALVYSAGDDTDPGQLWLQTGGTEKKLTAFNRDLLAEVEVGRAEPYTYLGADGWECQGWIVKPPGFRSGQQYPAIVEIHGGPHSMFGHGFFHEFQFLAAQGYVVVYTNPRGSQGYGQRFTNACRGDWGGGDFVDIMAGLDAAIEMGFIDTSRLGVTGGSYGGYMTCWIVSHSDRFKAAVTQRALTNRYSFYGTSDIGPRFGESEYPGNPWDDHELLFDRSPVHYVKNIHTPLLIIHSEDDLRCPIEQAEQVFVALKRMRRTTQFVRFPGENHELSRSGKPKHRRERLERIAGWFKKYL